MNRLFFREPLPPDSSRFSWLWHLGYAFRFHCEALSYHVGWWVWQAPQLLACWWGGRRTRDLLAGLPVLLALLATTVVTVRALNPWYVHCEDYERRAALALQEGDFGVAEVCYLRLVQQDEQRPEYRFGLARAAAGLGQTERARALIVRLAPASSAGYPLAHLVRAQDYLRQADASVSARHAGVLHLELALQKQPDLVAAHILLGQQYHALGRPLEAEPHLRKGVASMPALHLVLARLYAEQGDKPGSEQEAQEVLQAFGKQATDLPPRQEAVLLCGEAQFLRHNYAGAVALFEKGLGQPWEAQAHQALARVYAAWAQALAQDAQADPAERLRLLGEGLRHDPTAPTLLQPLLEWTEQKGEGAGQARQLLEGALVRGQSSPLVHVLLGMEELKQGNTERAKVHLEQAYRLAPDAAVVSNNLAWVLADGPHPDLARALALANAAVEHWPKQPHFRDTRGQILMRLDRWQEALADLELALPAMPKDRRLHQALAETYRHLGMASLAEQHQKLAGPSAIRPSGS